MSIQCPNGIALLYRGQEEDEKDAALVGLPKKKAANKKAAKSVRRSTRVRATAKEVPVDRLPKVRPAAWLHSAAPASALTQSSRDTGPEASRLDQCHHW